MLRECYERLFIKAPAFVVQKMALFLLKNEVGLKLPEFRDASSNC